MKLNKRIQSSWLVRLEVKPLQARKSVSLNGKSFPPAILVTIFSTPLGLMKRSQAIRPISSLGKLRMWSARFLITFRALQLGTQGT